MKRILLISALLLTVIFTVSADRRRLLGARNVAAASGSIWATNTAATATGFAVGYDTSFYYLGQQTVPGSNVNVTSVSWVLSKAGTISGSFTYACKIFAMSGNDLGTLTGTSATVLGDNGWSETTVVFTFSSPVTLSSGTDYAFTLQRIDGGTSTANYAIPRCTAAGGFAGNYAHWRSSLVRETFDTYDCKIGIVIE